LIKKNSINENTNIKVNENFIETKNERALPSINEKIDENNILNQTGEVILKFDNSKRDKRQKRLSKESIIPINNEKDMEEVNQSVKN